MYPLLTLERAWEEERQIKTKQTTQLRRSAKQGFRATDFLVLLYISTSTRRPNHPKRTQIAADCRQCVSTPSPLDAYEKYFCKAGRFLVATVFSFTSVLKLCIWEDNLLCMYIRSTYLRGLLTLEALDIDAFIRYDN